MLNEATIKAFADDALSLLSGLEEWAPSLGVTIEKQNAVWPKEGCVKVTKGSRSVEIFVRKPEEIGTATQQDGAWGFEIREGLLQATNYVARWPEGWRAWNRVRLGWDNVELSSYMYSVLSRSLGVTR